MLKFILTTILLALVWVPMPGSEKTLNNWVLEADNGRMIGRCFIVKPQGPGKWRGVYYGKPTDFYEGQFASKDKNTLYECTEWVNRFVMGGWYN